MLFRSFNIHLYPLFPSHDRLERLYEVSNKGRVRSVDRVFVRKNGRIQPVKGKILKQTKDKDGYCKVYLSNQGIKKNVFVHRLVAEAFIPNPDNLPQVNHINSKKDDNRVENLEWVTNQQNVQHAYDFGNGLKGLDHPNADADVCNKKRLLLFLLI